MSDNARTRDGSLEIGTYQYPPDPVEIEDEFRQAVREANDFEDTRWMVWFYDSLENHEWENARWQGFVLHEKGYDELITVVDREFGRWLDNE